jgi:type I restriction enzyme S subunit
MTNLTQKLKDKGWVETTLGEVILNKNQGVNTTVEKVEYTKEGFKILRAKDISSKQIDFLNTEHVSKLTFEKLSNRVKPKLNDLLYTNIGSQMGLCAKVSMNEPFGIAWNILRITANSEKITTDFLLNFLSWNETRAKISTRNSSSTMPFINGSDFDSFPILLPPLPTQKAIADVLSSLDDKIELLREQNKILEETAQTVFKEWFGKYSVERPEELPEGWRVGKLGEIIKREPVSYKCDKKDLDENGTTPIIDQGANGLYGFTSRKPDFIASFENPVILFTNHTCNYWFVDYNFCAIQNVLPFRGKGGYDEYFLYFMTKDVVKFIEYKGHWPDLEVKDFVIPTVEFAQKFSKMSKPTLQKISDNKKQIQTLTQTRDTLLPRLMSGEVEV